MKLALLSDSHNNTHNLEKAVAEANKRSCDVLIHSGDLMEPSYIDLLREFKGNVIFVFGNNDNEKEEIRERSKGSNVLVAGDFYDGVIDGQRVYVTHYPESAKIAFLSGSYDVVVFGHTHQKMTEALGEKILINPGEIYGRRMEPASWAIYDTKTKHIEFIEIS
ncbi:MAG: metallophosphoesterase [Candidatus Paceibacterota bacterium]